LTALIRTPVAETSLGAPVTEDKLLGATHHAV